MQQEYLYFGASNAWFRTDTIWWLILYIALNAQKNFSLLCFKHAYLLQDWILLCFLFSIISHMHPDHHFHTYTACAKCTYYLVWPHHTNFIGTNTEKNSGSFQLLLQNENLGCFSEPPLMSIVSLSHHLWVGWFYDRHDTAWHYS